MAAFEQKRASMALDEGFPSFFDFSNVSARQAGKDAKLVEIRSHKSRQRKKEVAVSGDRSGLEERIPAGGHHHGINDQGGSMPAITQSLRHRANDGGGIKHSSLHRRDGKGLKAHADLLGNHLRADGLDGRNPPRNLSHDASNSRLGIGTECGDGFEIGLNAGSAGIIRSGDRENDGGSFCQPGEACFHVRESIVLFASHS